MIRPFLHSPPSGLLFDRQLLRMRRNRIAPLYFSVLKNIVIKDLVQRLRFIRRNFSYGVDLGGHTGQLTKALKEMLSIDLITTDLSELMIAQVPSFLRLVADEENLPFCENSLDLMISALSLHWVNDLPGLLAQVRYSLKPDGLFLAALLGEDSLIELRDCFASAELELQDGITPRFSPMLSIKDAGMLLQRASFALPVVDRNRIQLTYSNPLALLHDLRKMGETNILYHRAQTFMPRTLLIRVVELYQKRYSLPNGHIFATFDVITLTGWAPHESQQKPLLRGSTQARLEDYILISDEKVC